MASLPETLLSPRAAGSYLANNLKRVPDLLGSGSGALMRRAMAAVRAERSLVVRGTDDVWTSGEWPTAGTPSDEPAGEGAAAIDLDDAPTAVVRATDGPTPVIVGWSTPTGPVALPGAWDAAHRIASVRRDVFEASGAAVSSPACVLFDRTKGTSLDAKAGLVLRGHATAHRRDDDAVDLALTVDRVTWWQGDTSKTVSPI